MNYKNKASKACDFPPKVRKEIATRDMNRCVYCGSKFGLQVAHVFVPRSKGGLGVKENGALMCSYGNNCHGKYDNGLDEEHEPIKEYVQSYMRKLYDINVHDLVYKKYAGFKFGN